MSEPTSPTSPSNQPRKWRGEIAPAGVAGGPAPAAKRKKIFSLLAVIMVIIGAIGYLFYILGPTTQPTFLPVFIVEYSDPRIPVIAQANQDRVKLRDAKLFEKETTAYAAQERNILERNLDGLGAKKKDEPVVVYLCAQTLCDALGEVCILPGNAQVDDPGSWIKLELVLTSLKKCPSRKKLLILDTMRPIDDPRLGVLSDDIAERVKDTLEKIPDEHRLTLCACSPGQVSLVSEELNQSVFGYYLSEGLQGWADGCLPPRRIQDDRISVKELAEYVRARVDRWAVRARGSRQTPVLYGSAPDFELLTLLKRPVHAADKPADKPGEKPAEGEAAKPEPPAGGAFPDWLRNAWAKRDEWWRDESYRIAPRVFREYEARVYDAELRWRGGVVPEEKDKLDKFISDFKAKIEQVKADFSQAEKALVVPERHSIALDVAAGARPDKAVADRLTALLRDFERLNRAFLPPKEIEKGKLEAREKFLESLKTAKPIDLPDAVWKKLFEETPVRPDRVQLLSELLRVVQPLPKYTEMVFLRRLDELAQSVGPDGIVWPSEVVKQAMQVVKDGEAAAACAAKATGRIEPRAFPWVREVLDRAAQRRHEGELFLFSPGYASFKEAAGQFTEAAANFALVNEAVGVIEEAARMVDEASARLVGMAPYLMRRPKLDLNEEADWKSAMQSLSELQDIMATQPAPDQPGLVPDDLRKKLDQVQEKTRQLQRELGRLIRPFDGDRRVTEFIESKIGHRTTPTDTADLNDALQIRWLTGSQREKIWTAWSKAVKQFQETVRLADEDDDRNLKPTPQQLDFDVAKARKEEHTAALRRAQFALDLLRIGGVTGVEKAITEPLEAATKNPAAMPALGHAFRLIWAEAIPDQLDKTQSMIVRERLGRVYGPFDADPKALLHDPKLNTNPSLSLVRQQMLGLWRWCGDRCQYEKQEAPAGADNLAQFMVDYYKDAARDYLQPVDDADKPQEFFYEFQAGDPPSLIDGKLSVPYQMSLRLTASPEQAKSEKTVQSITPDQDRPVNDRRLRLTLPASGPGFTATNETGTVVLDGPGPEFQLPYTVSVDPNKDIPLRGFFLQASVAGRAFHRRVPVNSPPPRNQRLQLLAGDTPKEPFGGLDDFRFRPNTKQTMFVFVRNPGKTARTVVVGVRAKEDNVEGPEALSKPVRVEPTKVERVTFDKPPTPADAPPPAPNAKAELPELRGPLVFRIYDEANKSTPLDMQELAVDISPPRQYIDVTKDPVFVPARPGQQNRLSVKLKPKSPIAGQPCPVELELTRRPTGVVGFGIPFLTGISAGNFLYSVPVKGTEEFELNATGLSFDRDRDDENGFVYVSVDGFKRAFIYRLTFKDEGTPVSPQEFRSLALRVSAPKQALPSPRSRVTIEVDNPPSDVTLEVGLKRAGNTQFTIESPNLQGARHRRIGFQPGGAGGSLAFETLLEDWARDINTEGIIGRCELRVRMLGEKGRTIKEAFAAIVIDPTEPENVRLVGAGEGGKLRPGETNRVVMEGVDNESGIESAKVYIGKPKDGKAPEGEGTPGTPKNEARTRWEAQLKIPEDAKGSIDLTTEFTNGVGKKAYATRSFQIKAGGKDAPPPAGKGKIKVAVIYNGERQPDVAVALIKDNKLKSTLKSDENGECLFEDLDAGQYQLSAEEKSVGRAGYTSAVAKDGTTAAAELKLRLK